MQNCWEIRLEMVYFSVNYCRYLKDDKLEEFIIAHRVLYKLSLMWTLPFKFLIR